MTIQELETRPSSRIEYSRFYFWMAVVIALTAFIGFSRTFFLMEWTSSPPLPPILHIHGIVATGWILLFLTQTTLIDHHRVDLHRRLGITGVVLAVLLLVTAILAGITMAQVRGGGPEALARLSLPFVAGPVFAILAGAGLYFRRKPEVHKRLMLLATINALTPALGRLPLVDAYMPVSFFILISLFLLAGVFYDVLTRGRPHFVTICGGLFVMASAPARVLLGQTESWMQFARWLF